MESAFRLLITLTHDNLLWCQVVVEDPVALFVLIRTVVASHRERMTLTIKKEDADESDESDETAQLLDRLCLSLGVLTNLIQNDPTSRDSLQDLGEY